MTSSGNTLLIQVLIGSIVLVKTCITCSIQLNVSYGLMVLCFMA